MAHDEKLSYKS